MGNFEKLEAAIRAQQKGKEGTDVFVAGEQLLDMCRGREDFAGIVLTDLGNKDMALEKAVEGIRQHAKKQRKGNFGYCSPQDAERILRKFYGLPEAGDAKPEPEKKAGRIVNLMDFI